MAEIGGGGGGWRAGLQSLLQRGQEALSKVRGDGKDTKGAEGKGEAKGTGGASSAGGARGAQGKGKAKGKDLAGVEKLISGSDDFGVEDEEKERRRKQRFFLGNDDRPPDFVVQDATQDRSAVAHISAEFRGQVASGMTAGRSFTQGSCLVPEQAPSDDDDLDDKPAKKNKRR